MIPAMTQHSVAEAKNRLSDLIDGTLNGEDIVITCHGHPVVTLKPVQPPARPVKPGDMAWLAARRINASPATDAGTLVSDMRDEDER
jgi:prevent-host-death family protein